MVTIRDHHKWKDPDHELVCDWPDTATVQWGSKGVVICRTKPNYKTAFFEVFDKSDPGTGFVRGEGETIADAERECFAKYTKYRACNHELFGRRGYTNGGGFCLKCGAFSSAFQPIVELGNWRKPVPYYDKWLIEEQSLDDPDLAKYTRRLLLRSKLFGFTERPTKGDT